MSTFTEKVQKIGQSIAKPGTEASVAEIARHLGVNPSTLRNAIKSDTAESPYTGSLTQAVDEAVPQTRSAPRGRLHGLVRKSELEWTASIGDEPLAIVKTDDGWRATNAKGKKVAEDKTFKGIIKTLRETASATV